MVLDQTPSIKANIPGTNNKAIRFSSSNFSADLHVLPASAVALNAPNRVKISN